MLIKLSIAKSIATRLGVVCLLLASTLATADVVRIPIGQQTADASLNLPQTGETKTQVREEHGDPLEARGPTGDPAIYRWDYRDFTVYFEDDRVIHAVVKFVPANLSEGG